MLVAGAHLLGFRNLVHRQLVLALLDQGERDAIVRRRDELVLAQHVEPLDRLPHPPARPLRVTLCSMNLAERHEQVAHPPVEVGSHERGHARSAVVRLAQRQALLQRRLRRLQLAFLHVSVGQHAHREAVHRRRGDDFGAQLVGAVHHLDGPLEVAVVQRGSRVLHGPHDQRGNLSSKEGRWTEVSDRGRDVAPGAWGRGRKSAKIEPQLWIGRGISFFAWRGWGSGAEAAGVETRASRVGSGAPAGGSARSRSPGSPCFVSYPVCIPNSPLAFVGGTAPASPLLTHAHARFLSPTAEGLALPYYP